MRSATWRSAWPRRIFGTASLAAALIAASSMFALPAHADDVPTPAPPPPYPAEPHEIPLTFTDNPKPPRTELAALPVISGNSDIGLQVGAAAFITRLADGEKPYRWKSDVILSLSVKPRPGGESGFDIAQQSHDIRLDIPRFLGTKLRFMPGIWYERHVNAGYFGLGNGAPAIALPNGTFGRRYQSITDEVRGRFNVRFPLYGRLDGMVGLLARYTDAEAYRGSKLEYDSRVIERDGDTRIFGLDPLVSAIPSAGVVYDTRDNEISPRKGAFDMYGIRLAGGIPTTRPWHEGFLYGGGSAVLRRYVPLPGPFMFAGRFVGDFIVGNAPFYDLAQGITFTPIDLIGGGSGLRGVPNGRYTGRIKMLATAELRAHLVTFRFLDQRFRVGATAFADVGRVWDDFKVDEVRNGKGIGLKYGIGGGLYFIWGEAAIIRLEVAYSPDATSANPGLPLGLYAADGHAF